MNAHKIVQKNEFIMTFVSIFSLSNFAQSKLGNTMQKTVSKIPFVSSFYTKLPFLETFFRENNDKKFFGHLKINLVRNA